MLTDADKDGKRNGGKDEDSRRPETLRAGKNAETLCNFIPVDRCLAGNNACEKGGQTEGGNEEYLQKG